VPRAAAPRRSEGSQASSPVSTRPGNFHQTLMDIRRAAPVFPDGALDWGVCRREGCTAGSGRSVVPVWGRINRACDRMRLPAALGDAILGNCFSSRSGRPCAALAPLPDNLVGEGVDPPQCLCACQVDHPPRRPSRCGSTPPRLAWAGRRAPLSQPCRRTMGHMRLDHSWSLLSRVEQCADPRVGYGRPWPRCGTPCSARHSPQRQLQFDC
jgi:hypothetical protein